MEIISRYILRGIYNRNGAYMESKNKMIPVIIWATGIIARSLRKYLDNLLRKYDVTEMQKRGILGTAYVLWKALM
jgi:hypothetical protein